MQSQQIAALAADGKHEHCVPDLIAPRTLSRYRPQFGETVAAGGVVNAARAEVAEAGKPIMPTLLCYRQTAMIINHEQLVADERQRCQEKQDAAAAIAQRQAEAAASKVVRDQENAATAARVAKKKADRTAKVWIC